jgi:hypothetical protein
MGTYNNFIVGPLVNACLLVSTSIVGIWAGVFIALAAPFGAILTGAAVPLPFAPFIAIGNFLIVLGFYLLMKRSQIAGVIVGSLVKFGFLWGAIYLMIPVITAGKPAKAAVQMTNSLMFTFSWPQLVTALIGGALALIVLKTVGKNME